MKYILSKGEERIEVLEGREERRDRLIRAGYAWVNEPRPDTPVDVTHVFTGAPDPDEIPEIRPLRRDKSA